MENIKVTPDPLSLTGNWLVVWAGGAKSFSSDIEAINYKNQLEAHFAKEN